MDENLMEHILELEKRIEALEHKEQRQLFFDVEKFFQTVDQAAPEAYRPLNANGNKVMDVLLGLIIHGLNQSQKELE